MMMPMKRLPFALTLAAFAVVVVLLVPGGNLAQESSPPMVVTEGQDVDSGNVPWQF